MAVTFLIFCILTTSFAYIPEYVYREGYQDYTLGPGSEGIYPNILRTAQEHYKLPKELYDLWSKKVDNKALLEDDGDSELKNTETETTNPLNDKPNTADINESNRPNDKLDGEKELAVKEKILHLITETKKVIDQKVAPLQEVHAAYKSQRFYKIGYLVSSINKTQDSVSDFYRHVQENVDNWDALKVLYAYEQVKEAYDFLNKAMLTLENLASSRTGDRNTRSFDFPLSPLLDIPLLSPQGLTPSPPKNHRQKLSYTQPFNYMPQISWHYYNDED